MVAASVGRFWRWRGHRELVGYCGLCESPDYQKGRLIAFLDESGSHDNMMLSFSSDYGELTLSHRKCRKG